jgi:hypothetical protein
VVAASHKEDQRHAIHSVGIDLGKTIFHLVAFGAAGKILVWKKFTLKRLLTYTANSQTSLIGLEACSRAHFLGRALRKQGHDAARTKEQSQWRVRSLVPRMVFNDRPT